jgi:hypothetical protein
VRAPVTLRRSTLGKMKKYKCYTFRNFVALNVVDDMHFVDPISFWIQAKRWEIKQAGKALLPDEGQGIAPLPGRVRLGERERLMPEAFEKSIQELLPFMEEGLIAIGDHNDFKEKTSYGHFAITVPEGTIYDAIQAARDDFAKDKDGRFEWCWMIQATTKGWEWANRQIAEMDNAEYHKEKHDFFHELS